MSEVHDTPRDGRDTPANPRGATPSPRPRPSEFMTSRGMGSMQGLPPSGEQADQGQQGGQADRAGQRRR